MKIRLKTEIRFYRTTMINNDQPIIFFGNNKKQSYICKDKDIVLLTL